MQERDVNQIIGTCICWKQEDTHGQGIVKDRDRDRDRNGNRDKDRNKERMHTYLQCLKWNQFTSEGKTSHVRTMTRSRHRATDKVRNRGKHNNGPTKRIGADTINV